MEEEEQVNDPILAQLNSAPQKEEDDPILAQLNQESGGGASMGFTEGSQEPQEQPSQPSEESGTPTDFSWGADSDRKLPDSPITEKEAIEQYAPAPPTRPKSEFEIKLSQQLKDNGVTVSEEEIGMFSTGKRPSSDTEMFKNRPEQPIDGQFGEDPEIIKIADKAITEQFPKLNQDEFFKGRVRIEMLKDNEFASKLASGNLSDQDKYTLVTGILSDKYTALEQKAISLEGQPTVENAATLTELNNTVAQYESLKSDYSKIDEAIKKQSELREQRADEPIKDIGARTLRSLNNFAVDMITLPASMASTLEDFSGIGDRYSISDKILDFAEQNFKENIYTDIVGSDRVFYKDGEVDPYAALLGASDQVGLLVGLAVGNSYGMLRAENLLSKSKNIGLSKQLFKQKTQNLYTVGGGFAASLEGNRREAKEMGLSGADAAAYTTFMSMMEGMSELAMPNNKLFSKELKDITLNTYIKNLSRGNRFALNEVRKVLQENMGKESFEEIMVMAGKTAQTAAMSVDNENIDVYIPTVDEVINTVATSSIAAGVPTIISNRNISKNITNQSLIKASENIEGTRDVLRAYVDKGIVKEKDAYALLNKLGIVKEATLEIPDNISLEDRAEILEVAEKLALKREEIKDKKGVARKVLQDEIDELEAQIESKLPNNIKQNEEAKENKPTVELYGDKQEVTRPEGATDKVNKLFDSRVQNATEKFDKAINDAVNKYGEDSKRVTELRAEKDKTISDLESKRANKLKGAVKKTSVQNDKDVDSLDDLGISDEELLELEDEIGFEEKTSQAPEVLEQGMVSDGGKNYEIISIDNKKDGSKVVKAKEVIEVTEDNIEDLQSKRKAPLKVGDKVYGTTKRYIGAVAEQIAKDNAVGVFEEKAPKPPKWKTKGTSKKQEVTTPTKTTSSKAKPTIEERTEEDIEKELEEDIKSIEKDQKDFEQAILDELAAKDRNRDLVSLKGNIYQVTRKPDGTFSVSKMREDGKLIGIKSDTTERKAAIAQFKRKQTQAEKSDMTQAEKLVEDTKKESEDRILKALDKAIQDTSFTRLRGQANDVVTVLGVTAANLSLRGVRAAYKAGVSLKEAIAIQYAKIKGTGITELEFKRFVLENLKPTSQKKQQQDKDEKETEEAPIVTEETTTEDITEAEKTKIAEEIGKARKVKPKNIKGLLDVMGGIFGLNKKQAESASVVGDVIIGNAAKRAGISKDEMYQKIAYQKAQMKDLPKGIKFQVDAWHGSPHTFDKFTTKKMGTGEGFQAFGWGLYFTDLPSIAEHYATAIGQNDSFFANAVDNSTLSLEAKVLAKGHYFESLDRVQAVELLLYNKKMSDDKIGFDEAIKFLKNYNPQRNLYKVSIHKGKTPEQYTWLGWDKPVSDKLIRNINKVLEKNNIPLEVLLGDTGREVYKSLSNWVNGSNGYSEKQASLFLLENGIDGIKYPAESIARGATSDNARGFNYVVFDENAVSIEEVIKFQKDAMKARGAMMMAMDNQAIIYALTDPNVSTPLHELAHVYEHYLTDTERKAIESWSGHKAGTVEFSEAFARGFEKFLAEGKVNNPKLQKIFENFKEWLTEIYNGITGSEIDIELNDKMKSIYNEMLGATPEKVKSTQTVAQETKGLSEKEKTKQGFIEYTEAIKEKSREKLDAATDKIKKRLDTQVQKLKDFKERKRVITSFANSLLTDLKKSGVKYVPTAKVKTILNLVNSAKTDDSLKTATDKLIQTIRDIAVTDKEVKLKAQRIDNVNQAKKNAKMGKFGNFESAYAILNLKEIPQQFEKEYYDVMSNLGQRGAFEIDVDAVNELYEKISKLPITEDITKEETIGDTTEGKKEITEVKSGTHTSSNPIKIFKGLGGKVDLNGVRINAHEGAEGVFTAVDEDLAKEYAKDKGMSEIILPAGTTFEVVEVDGTGMTPGQYRAAEVKAINDSKADVVKLITVDGRIKAGTKKQEQYVVKNLKLIESKLDITETVAAIDEAKQDLTDENIKELPSDYISDIRQFIKVPTEFLNRYNKQFLKNLEAAVKNAKNGIMTGNAITSVVRDYEASLDAKDIVDNNILEKTAEQAKKVFKGASKIFTKNYYKNRKSKNVPQLVGELSNKYTAYFDSVLGSLKGTPIYEAFNNITSKKSTAESQTNNTKAEFTKKLKSAIRSRIPFIKRMSQVSGEPFFRLSVRSQLYLQQKQFESNRKSKGVQSVDDIIKNIKENLVEYEAATNLTPKEIEIIIDEYNKGAVDGNLSAEKMWADMNSKERDLIKFMRAELDKSGKKSEYINIAFRNNPLPQYKDYFPRSGSTVVTEGFDFFQSLKDGKIGRQSFKTRSSNERARTIDFISFSPFNDFMNHITSVNYDYYLTPEVSRFTSMTGQIGDIANQQETKRVAESMNQIMKATLNTSFNETNKATNSTFSDVLGRSVLGGITRNLLIKPTRLISEFVFNYLPVVTLKSKSLLKTLPERKAFNKVDALKKIQERFGSAQQSRVGAYKLDMKDLGQGLDKRFNSISSEVKDAAERFIRSNYLTDFSKGASQLFYEITDSAAKPIWEATFLEEFKKESGSEFDAAEFVKDNNEYSDKYKRSIEKAKARADKRTSAIFNTAERMESKLNQQKRTGLKSLFYDFMQSFAYNEAPAIKEAVHSTLGHGAYGRMEGVTTLLALSTRAVGYQVLNAYLFDLASNLVINLISEGKFSFDDEDDEYDLKITDELNKGLASFALLMAIGNKAAWVKGLVAIGTNAAYQYGYYPFFTERGKEGKEFDIYQDSPLFSPNISKQGATGFAGGLGILNNESQKLAKATDKFLSKSMPRLAEGDLTLNEAIDIMNESKMSYYAWKNFNKVTGIPMGGMEYSILKGLDNKDNVKPAF